MLVAYLITVRKNVNCIEMLRSGDKVMNAFKHLIIFMAKDLGQSFNFFIPVWYFCKPGSQLWGSHSSCSDIKSHFTHPWQRKFSILGNKTMWKSTFPMHCNMWLLDTNCTTSTHLGHDTDEAFWNPLLPLVFPPISPTVMHLLFYCWKMKNRFPLFALQREFCIEAKNSWCSLRWSGSSWSSLPNSLQGVFPSEEQRCWQ